MGVPPYPRPHHDTAPWKPVVDLGSIMIYEDSPGLEYIDMYNAMTEPWAKGPNFHQSMSLQFLQLQ